MNSWSPKEALLMTLFAMLVVTSVVFASAVLWSNHQSRIEIDRILRGDPTP